MTFRRVLFRSPVLSMSPKTPSSRTIASACPDPEPPMSQLAHRRVLLKLSGEALMGAEDYGIDPLVIHRLAREVIEAQQAGAEIALVIGGGNIFRDRKSVV